MSGRKLLDRHQILRRCCSLHPWHGDANLLRIYDCELVTQDTSSFSSFIRSAMHFSTAIRVAMNKTNLFSMFMLEEPS